MGLTLPLGGHWRISNLFWMSIRGFGVSYESSPAQVMVVPLFCRFEVLSSFGCVGVVTKGLDLVILWSELFLGEGGFIVHLLFLF